MLPFCICLVLDIALSQLYLICRLMPDGVDANERRKTKRPANQKFAGRLKNQTD